MLKKGGSLIIGEMKEATYQRIKLSHLVPADYNPRKIDVEELEGLGNSIDRFGLVQAIVWNKRTGNVVGGHQRLKVLLARNVEDATVAVVDVDETTEMALNVTLNNPHVEGKYTGGLQDILQLIRDEDLGMLKSVNLDRLLDVVPDFAEDDAGEVEEDVEPVTKTGDLWILGSHRLLCGSSAEHEDVMRLIGEETTSCMWTDPPYGVDFQRAPDSNRGETKKGPLRDKYLRTIKERVIQNDGADEAMDTLAKAMALAFEYVLRPSAAIYVCHPPGPLSIRFGQILQETGFSPRQSLVWFKKNKFTFGRSDYHWQHEPIWYGYKKGDTQFGRMGQAGWYGGNGESTVFQIDRPLKSAEHPAMKPIKLITPMIKNSSRVGDWIYEPFAGSGSTLIACEKTDRRCLAIELEPKYCDVIVNRWQNETGKDAYREDKKP